MKSEDLVTRTQLTCQDFFSNSFSAMRVLCFLICSTEQTSVRSKQIFCSIALYFTHLHCNGIGKSNNICLVVGSCLCITTQEFFWWENITCISNISWLRKLWMVDMQCIHCYNSVRRLLKQCKQSKQIIYSRNIFSALFQVSISIHIIQYISTYTKQRQYLFPANGWHQQYRIKTEFRIL